MVLILSGRFSNCPYGFKTIRVVSKLFGPFNTVQTVQCPEMSTFSLIRHMNRKSESRPQSEIYILSAVPEAVEHSICFFASHYL